MSSGFKQIVPYSLFYSNAAKKFIQKKADPKLRKRLLTLQHVLESNPVPAREYDLRKLEGFDDHFRIRISSFRVVYKVKQNDKEIHVLKIERKDDSTYK